MIDAGQFKEVLDMLKGLVADLEVNRPLTREEVEHIRVALTRALAKTNQIERFGAGSAIASNRRLKT